MIKTNNKGLLIVVSGPSGAGKDTICQKLIKENSNIWMSVSMTTRKPRPLEKDGVDYFFVSSEEFENKINDNTFLEYASYNDNYYGTPKDKVEEKLNEGKDVILVIDINGAINIKKIIPSALFIFIMPPDMETLKNRLIGRKTESKDKVVKRFITAYNEVNNYKKYNYVVVNDKVEDAVNKVKSIIQSEKCRVDRIEDIYLGNKEELIHEILIDKNFENNY
ncbi:guanylate kinase [Mycoplasma sp. CAG:472]|jgi:guanylate kinase|nr:guanylate kinase [Mycoplasma sp. CAG:472]